MQGSQLNKHEDSLSIKEYTNSVDYLLDEFRALDMRLYLEILKEKESQSKDLFEELKGLVLSEKEVYRLLGIDIPKRNSNEDIGELEKKIHNIEQIIEIKKELTLEREIFLSLPCFSNVLGLSEFEQKCVIVCLAIELNRKYEKLYAFLQDDLNCKRPTIDLCMKLFCRNEVEKIEFRKYFEKESKLNKYFLEKRDGQENRKTFLSRSLKIEKGIVALLLETWEEDENDPKYMEVVHPSGDLSKLLLNEEIHLKICNYKAKNLQHNKETIFFIWGNEGAGKKFHVKHFCRHFNKLLLLVDLKEICNCEEESFEGYINKALSRGRFLEFALCFFNFEYLVEDEVANSKKINFLMREISTYKEDLFILCKEQWKGKTSFKYNLFLDIELEIPEEQERKALWQQYGKDYVFHKEVQFQVIANKFKFTPGQIQNALESAKVHSIWNTNSEEIHTKEISKASYSQVQHNLQKKATLIHPKYTWEDLILPFDAKVQVMNAVNQVKYRHVVYGQWGFDKKLSYGKGLSMLFAGPPGTGKTMAAQVVANALDLEIYKIDLSQIISKYIGETEKNLNEIFNEARISNAILFFDETDALFGKRSEVKDSNDKYSNIETSYLLQKMEEYDGISVLATNFLQNIDEAFIRRINYIIKFPFPDPKYRELLWKNMFPKETPLNGDIDFAYLANKFKIAGGNIKNVVVSSAFLAAEQNEAVSMKHIINATKHELEKSGKVLLKEDIMEYYHLLFLE